MSRLFSFAAALFVMGSYLVATQAFGQAFEEKMLVPDNAYNPIPSPDGKLIAYVRTGWGRPGGSGGFGRSNLVSEVMVVDANGKLLSSSRAADAFLADWTADGSGLILYRDWKYSVAEISGKVSLRGERKNPAEGAPTERIFYLRGSDTIGWSRMGEKNETIIESNDQVIARHEGWIGQHVVPSPDGRYLAVFGEEPKTDLYVYDMQIEKWFDLGKITVHPDPTWDYIKPTWSPWFADSSRLAYFSDSNLVISEPNGNSRRTFFVRGEVGLATPSPNGMAVAYVTFDPRPMKVRPDLSFYGGTTIWVLPLSPQSEAFEVTGKNDATTDDLRWVNNDALVFDRIEDEPFMKQAHLWKVPVRQ